VYNMSIPENIQKIYRILNNHERRIRELEKIISKLRDTSISEIKKEIIKVPSFQKLSRKIGVPESVLERLFDIEDESITLLDIIGESHKERTQNATLVVLLAYKYVFNREEVLAREIKRNIAELGISLANFPRYLNEIIPTFIRRKGKPRSPKTTYKLTLQGEVRAKEILKTLGEIYAQEAA